MLENFEKSTKYARELFKEDNDIQFIKEYGIKNNIPIVTEEVLNFLIFLLSSKKYKKSLEIGTAIGYSGAYISKYSDLTSIEIDKERFEIAKSNFSKLSRKVNLINADALEILENLNENFDFIFIDAAKGQYKKFFDMCYNKLNNGGLIFIDNIMFRSYVTIDEYPKKFKTIVKKLNEFIIYLNENYEFSLLPFGDGVGLVRKGK
ncbi:O-methyltransferase [Oceanivirga salmonicida]|uniref:O-methyltransferase n=1 Tax=Oceanivirga salmonicida TaxID=1769291 RepID=UPI0008302D51|nr:O-methyltransferase [Oceanivirga salmonicida]